MPVDIDLVVEPSPAHPPLGVLIGLGRQLLQCRAVQLEEQATPADAEPAHGPRVEIGDQLGNSLVKLGKREEAAVPQPRQDPALDHQHDDLNLGFVARFAGARRQDGGAVMGREIEIGAVQAGFVPVCAIDPDPGVVGHELRHP